jgi:hypothetical protein
MFLHLAILELFPRLVAVLGSLRTHHIRVNMLQNMPYHSKMYNSNLTERAVHHRLPLTLCGPSMRRKRHESVMSSVMTSIMGSGPKR